MVDSSASLRPQVWLLSVIAPVVILGLSQTGCKTSAVSSSTMSMQAQAKIQAQAGTSGSNPPAAILVCPGSSTVPSELPAKGGHRVILSWKASPPGNTKHAAAAGYCIYRGAVGERIPAELLNHFPFSGNTCADDLVENGKRYSYLVRAISDKGVTSTASRPAPAAIPKQPRASSDVPTGSTPLCRQPTGLK